MNKKMHIKKGDTVCLMTGKFNDKYSDDKGTRRTGKVLEVSPKEGKVIIEGISLATKHVKPTKMGQPGGIIKVESAVYACKVQVYCSKCKVPVRTGMKIDGDKKIRVCKKCGGEIK